MEYKIKGKRGIDDLSSEYAFRGSSQGDESATNSLAEYKASEGWLMPVFNPIHITSQEAIDKEIERRKKANLEYIQLLKDEGRYGQEYDTIIELIHNPLLDENNTLSNHPVKSSRIIFLNFNDTDNDPRRKTNGNSQM